MLLSIAYRIEDIVDLCDVGTCVSQYSRTGRVHASIVIESTQERFLDMHIFE